MKIFVVLASILAVTTSTYLGPQHIPVIGPNGVPVEPHAVQAARANHLAAVASASGHASILAPYSHAPFTAFGVPTLGHNALPLDTPEVAAAKVQHYRDFAVAAGLNGVHVASPVVAAPIWGGHVVDTPEVQVAKAAHFAAHAEAASRNGGHAHYRKRRSVYGGYHIPVIGPQGVPLDTPEVQAARASHLNALAQASSRGGPAHYAEPWAEHRYYGPQATIGRDGQPVETPEVQAATAYHLAAHAHVRSNLYNHY